MRSDDDRWETRRPRRPRLDQWMTTGRQLVDGVAGTRPGSRGDGRSEGRSGGGLRLNGVGRWVETKLDWLLEDDDGWRESWEEPEPWRRPSEPRQPERQRPSSRTPLQAVSRRPGPGQAVPAPQDWPDADSFTLNRWSRADASPRPADPPPRGELAALDQAASRPPGRALPRSSRRRFDDPS